jgi:hypothetical protein
MKELTSGQVSANDALLEFGKVLGQGLAFGTVAGRCSAAQAAALRQARNEKVHMRIGLKWREFCPKHLKMSGSQADEIIRLLEEFGPDYFEHTQSVRISADTYRLVAPFIQDKTLLHREDVLELNSVNVQKVAKAIRESQRALAPPAEAAPPQPEEPAATQIFSDRVDALDRRITEILAEFRDVGKRAREVKPSVVSKSLFRSVLVRMAYELKLVSQENGVG